jgi:hypothetical protein
MIDIVFFSDTTDPSVPAIGTGCAGSKLGLPCKTKFALEYMHKSFPSAQWYVRAMDDTLLVLENLTWHLKHADASTPLVLGDFFYWDPNSTSSFHEPGSGPSEVRYPAGGSGWAVSRAAMEIIAANGFVYIETLYTINAIEQQWQQHGVWLDAHKVLRRQLPLRRQPDGSLKPKVMLGAPACKEVQLREAGGSYNFSWTGEMVGREPLYSHSQKGQPPLFLLFRALQGVWTMAFNTSSDAQSYYTSPTLMRDNWDVFRENRWITGSTLVNSTCIQSTPLVS